MEGVAAAASVAGILTLVSQSISGLVKLKGFYARLETASRTVDNFIQDINSLLQALNGVERILARWPDESADVHIASLHVQVEACFTDIFDWLKTARDMRPASNKGGKAWFKRFWIAASKDEVNDIRLEISRHRHALNTSLALIGRYLLNSISTLTAAKRSIHRSFDFDSSQQLRMLDEKIDSLTLLSNSSRGLQ